MWAQAVLFGFAHYQFGLGLGNVSVVTATAGIGVVLGYTAHLTRRLGAGIDRPRLVQPLRHPYHYRSHQMTAPSAHRDPTLPEPPERHHRDIQGGAARAAVLGVSDGLVTNVSLILGVAGANTAPGTDPPGRAWPGLLAGAFSMAAGEYVSMKAQTELLERELEMEALELRRGPDAERAELAQLYESRGVDPDVAGELAEEMMRTPELALETHAREELGVDPSSLGNPYQAAVASAGQLRGGRPGAPDAVVLRPRGGGGHDLAGARRGGRDHDRLALARYTGRSALHSSVRQLIVTVAAAGVTYGLGRPGRHPPHVAPPAAFPPPPPPPRAERLRPRHHRRGCHRRRHCQRHRRPRSDRGPHRQRRLPSPARRPSAEPPPGASLLAEAGSS